MGISLACGQMLPPLRDSDIRRDSMIRGTTPTLEFTLPFDTSLIAEMYVTIAQGEKTVLEKTLSDCSCSGTSVSLALTQEDTLRLQQQPHSRAEMQIRVRTTAGEALASDIMRVYVGRILKEGVI